MSILSNSAGSKAFEDFIEGMAWEVRKEVLLTMDDSTKEGGGILKKLSSIILCGFYSVIYNQRIMCHCKNHMKAIGGKDLGDKKTVNIFNSMMPLFARDFFST